MALTDHGNMFGMLHFAKAAKKVGIKPIFGMEAYVAPTRRDVKEKIEGIPPAFHICLFAMNDIGLKNLFKLSSLAYTEGFYYKPRIDDELLSTYKEGLIVTSACLKGKIQWYLMQQAQAETEANADGWLQLAYDEAGKMKDMLGDCFYIELQRGMKEHEQILPWQVIIAKKFDIPCIVTSDAHYSNREDSKFHEQIVCLSTGKTINDENRLIFSTDTLFLHSEAEAREQFPEWPEAIDNTQLLADRCNVTLPEHYDYIFPVYGDDDVEEFKREARAGLAQKGLDTDTRYVERLEYEISTIVDMGFPSYFLVVADYIRWAREQGIAVGPGRGSAAGSVVAWVLGITTVDSIEYGLLFQRFLNKGRKEMPDIDVDFCQDRRGEVIEYLTRRYGAGKVAQIATFAGFKPRGAVRDFCRVQGEPYALGEKASKLIPAAIRGKEPSWEKTLKESPGLRSDDFNDIINMAQKSEGLIKQAGMHAAGVAIAPVDILNHCPVFLGKKKELVCQWDKKQVEQVGLVKMDILGLSNLTIIDTCLRLVKATRGEDIDILNIPMDDPEAYDVVCKGDVSGLFQLEGGGGIQELSMKLKPRSVGEIAAISALYRPGPLDSGTADEYVARAQGHNEVIYLVPELEPILKETYGLLIYQEQAMKIATDLGGYTLEEADDLRKAIGKKIQEKMDEQEEKLLAGMKNINISEDKAREIWETIKVFADYGFNKTLDKNTKVCTIEGIKRIEDCKSGDTVFTWADDNTIKHSKVVALHDHGKVPLWEVEFNDGSVERCTLDHKWLTEHGQLPLWEIIQMDIPVWGSPIYTAKARGSSSVLLPMHAAQENEREALYLSRLPTRVSISSAISDTQKGVQKIPLFGEKWQARTQTQEDAVWSKLIYDTTRSQVPQTELRKVPGNPQTNQGPELQRFGTYRRNAQEILRNRQKNISKTRDSKAKSRKTSQLESYAPRENGRDNSKSSSFTKEIKNGSLVGTLSLADRIHKKCPTKMRFTRKETSRLCKSWAKNSRGGRRTLALSANTISSEPRQGSAKRQNARAGNIKTRLEINPTINAEFQEQLWRTYISRPGSINQNYPRRPVARYALLRKPIRISFCGFKQGYDLEVDHPAHNFFLASGHCCSNSHAVAYSIITYQTAWLKAHYPAEFYCALMTIRYKDRTKVMEYLRDCRKADIQVLAPDVNESKVGFTVIQGVVRFGLSAIKGIGEKIAKKIALEREKNGPFGDIFAFYARTGVTRNVMEVLAMAGALGSLDIGRAGVLEILDDLVGHKTQIAKYEKKLVTYEKKLEAVRERAVLRAELQEQGEKKSKIPNALKEPEKPIQPLDVAIPECEELDLDELLSLEYETLGIYVTSHPLYAYEQEIMGKSNAHTASLGDGSKGEHIRVVGVVNHVKDITTRKGAKMAVIVLEDLHGTIEVTVFSRLYADVSQKLEEGRVLLVGGRVDSVDENLHKIIATGIEDLTKKRARRPGRGKEPKEAKLIITEPSEELLQQMADIITASPGQCVLTVVLQLGRYEYTLDKPATVSSKALASFKTLGGTRITIR